MTARVFGLALLALLPGLTAAAAELPEDFVRLSELAPSIPQDIRYHGKHNFLGTRVEGYEAAHCILTRPAAQALLRAQQALAPEGLSLLVFDCYRPQRAVAHFMRWARTPDDAMLRALYYPRLDKRALLREVYIADKSGHSRGSTVDLTLVRAESYRSASGHDGCQPASARQSAMLDMGSGFDCFDPLSHTDNDGITPAQRANRQRLKAAMKQAGFHNYSREWWHYILNREPYPETYFDFPVR